MLLGASVLPADEVALSFRNPPDDTKPWCYWYWLNNDYTAEGITKDLETMASVGIRLAMIGNVHTDLGSAKQGNVKVFSPEWYELTRHAMAEAARVGVELYMFNGPGWSQSGGPWIKPEQSMRRITWNEIPAQGGSFSQKIRPDSQPLVQDVAVLAVPRKPHVAVHGTPPPVPAGKVDLTAASWIWHPAEDGARSAPVGTRYFRHALELDPATLADARMMISADNAHVLWINGKEVHQGSEWNQPEEFSILAHLRKGVNVIAVSATNHEAGAAGLIAAVGLFGKDGNAQALTTDGTWLASTVEADGWRENVKHPDGWQTARVLGPVSMAPWGLTGSQKQEALHFQHSELFTARALIVEGQVNARLHAVVNGRRELIAEIHPGTRNPQTDFLPDSIRTYSFKDVTAREFVLEPCNLDGQRVTLTSEPQVAQVIEKQMGRLHPTPSPSWDSYRFAESAEPGDPSILIRRDEILNLSDKLGGDGVLTCTLPSGDWTILYFGMVTTGKQNTPAAPEATGLEVDKLSRKHVEHHFDSMMGDILKRLSPEERVAFTGVTIDSYEVGSQNWTDNFDQAFEKRNGYDPIPLLPVFTGRVVDSAKISDQFLWDLRRTLADMIATEYVGGLRDIANRNGLKLWCENYGHWGFPGEFLIYGGYADEIGGEFWTNWNLGQIECRAASSAAHIYGKQRVYCEAFTSFLDLNHHPYSIKARGEQLFCEGINHFVLSTNTHQPRDGVPGRNPGFGTAAHRNNPWFTQSRDWVKYLQRVHYMLQMGEPAADVAVYVGDFAPQMTGPANPVPGGYDFDYMGSDALLRTVQAKDEQMIVHDEKNPNRISSRYRVLAMHPHASQTMRPQVRARLEELKNAGVPIVDHVPVPTDKLLELGIRPLVRGETCPIRWKARRLDDGMIFFLSNFGKAGTFEATLRVHGKTPELFHPVTGEIRTLARYRTDGEGTRITIDVRDSSDAFFIVFRKTETRPSVLDVLADGRAVGANELDLFRDNQGRLTARAAKSGSYTLVMSDGAEKQLKLTRESSTLPLPDQWATTRKDAQGFSVFHETTFTVPAGFGKGQQVELDLGPVEVMAKVTLNGKDYATLWMPPFTLDVTDSLKSGENRLKVLVTSTSQGQPKIVGPVSLRTVIRGTVD